MIYIQERYSSFIIAGFVKKMLQSREGQELVVREKPVQVREKPRGHLGNLEENSVSFSAIVYYKK